jgi:hypothetical protein
VAFKDRKTPAGYSIVNCSIFSPQTAAAQTAPQAAALRAAPQAAALRAAPQAAALRAAQSPHHNTTTPQQHNTTTQQHNNTTQSPNAHKRANSAFSGVKKKEETNKKWENHAPQHYGYGEYLRQGNRR